MTLEESREIIPLMESMIGQIEEQQTLMAEMILEMQNQDTQLSLMQELNNPVPVSLLSGDRKPQIRFLGNHHSGSGNLYHKSFRM